MKKRLHSFLFGIICLLSGCAHDSLQPPDTRPIEGTASARTCEIHFYVSSATSSKLHRDAKYNSAEIIVAHGVGSKSSERVHGKWLNRLTVDASSAKGKRVCEIINAAEPWEWEGTTIDHFGDNLYFYGNCEGKSWKYQSVYPDKKLEAVLVELRRELDLK